MYTACGISPEWVVFNGGMLCNHQNLPEMGIMLARKKKKGRGSILPWSLKSLTQAGMFVLHNSPKLEEHGATHASKPGGNWHIQSVAKILFKMQHFAQNLICKPPSALWYFNGMFSFIAPLNFMQLHSSSTEPMHLLSAFCDALSSSSLCHSVFLNSRMKNPKRHLFGFSLFVPSLLCTR